MKLLTNFVDWIQIYTWNAFKTIGIYLQHLWTVYHRKRNQKFRGVGYLNYIYKTKLDKACFAYYTVDANSKDLAMITTSYKILNDRAYEIARNYKCDRYHRELASMMYKFFDQKMGSGMTSIIKENVNKIVKIVKQLKQFLMVLLKQ